MPWTDGMEPTEVGYIQNKGWDKLDGDALAKTIFTSYRHLEKLHGAPADKILRLPDELTEDATKPIFERLGVPSDPAKYDFSSLKGADGNPLPETRVAELRQLAATGRMTQAAALKFAESYQTTVNTLLSGAATEATNAAAKATLDRNEVIVQTKLKNTAALQAEWGTNYDVKVTDAQRALAALGYTAEDLVALAGEAKYLQVMKMGDKLAQVSRESPLLGNGTSTGPNPGDMPKSEEQLLARKNEIFESNKGKMLTPDQAEKVFKEMADIDRQLVMMRHQRR